MLEMTAVTRDVFSVPVGSEEYELTDSETGEFVASVVLDRSSMEWLVVDEVGSELLDERFPTAEAARVGTEERLL